MGSQQALDRGTQVLAIALAAAAAGWFVYLWLISDAAWLHPEMLGSSHYVWVRSGADSLLTQLRRVADWKAFDPNVNRVRPLNDAFEVLDAIARPYVTAVVGPQASLLPSIVLTIVLAPAFLFGWLRRILGACVPALILTLVFLSSMSFLSVTVASMHPAKRLSVVLLCAALYFAQRYQDEEKGFGWLAGSLFAGFFADEMGLAAYPVIALLYWRSLRGRSLVLFLLLPVAFLVVTKWVLPTFYLYASLHGRWDALADSKKLAVFRYLLEPDFYVAAIRQTARSILSTLGIGWHVPATEAAALIAALGLTAWRRAAVPALLALLATSVYATLLDWYPFPNEISYLGSYNYYYHSPIAVLVIVWLAYVVKDLALPAPALAVLGALVVAGNFVLFERVNTLASIIHMYPYGNAEIFRALERPGPAVTVTPDAQGEDARFERALRAVFGERWRDNGFYATHELLKPTPLMGETQIKLLFHAYYPWIRVESVAPQ